MTDWDGAITRGPEAFARDVAAGDRGRGGRRGGGPGANGNGNGWSSGRADSERRAPVPVMAAGVGAGVPLGAVAVGPGGTIEHAIAPPSAVPPASDTQHTPRPDEIRPGVPRVSPLRAEAQVGGELPRIAPAEPISTYTEPVGLATSQATGGRAEADEEPALPDEARAGGLQLPAPTSQLESQPDQILHVRFGGAAPDRLVLAMETFHALLRERPGGTRVVLHVPAPTGSGSLPMELSRRVAYDAELLSEVRRRLGEGLVDLTLG